MRRLLSVALIVPIAMLPSLAWTDPTAIGFRVGVLIPPVPSLEKPLRESLRDIGYSDSSSPPIEWRRSDGSHEELKSLALDLIERDVDVIVVWGTPAVRAVLDATKTVPVVFCIADPLATGIVTSLASPGGNATGMGLLTRELTAKRLQLLRQLLPMARCIGYLRNPANPIAPRMFTESEQAAVTLGVELVAIDARDSREVRSTLRTLPDKRLDALIVSGDLLFLKERAQIARSVRTARLPTAFPGRENLETGAVMSYGWNMKDVMRSTAAYVDKIRKGAKPSELPVEQVSRYELIINLRVARELGVDVPQDMLLRADHVIR